MKLIPTCFVVVVFLLATSAGAQDELRPAAELETQSQFLEPGKWWNLYFAGENGPLRTIKAVKIVRFHETRPSWVQIAFPKNRQEHLSIFGPAAKAHDDPSVNIDAALAEWERSVTEWKTIWVNLDYVAHMSKVEPSHATESATSSTTNGTSSPPAR